MILLIWGEGCAWSRGVPGLGKGVWYLGGSAPGGWLVPGGEPPGTGTAAGGTHPTGMHSC